MSRVADFEHVVLDPLTGRPEADWQRAPAGLQAARGTSPAARVGVADAERHVRDGLARWAALESRPVAGDAGIFVYHPRLGDLDLEEWLRFHAWHCRHHAKQIRSRLAG